MGRFKLDKAGVQKIRHMLERQVTETKKHFATEAYEWLIDFGYHLDGGGPNDENHGYTWYTAANWNCSVNSPDTSMLQPIRPADVKESDVASYNINTGSYISYDPDTNKARIDFASAKFTDNLFVTQTSYYIQQLNEGGVINVRGGIQSSPNRFLELCESHLRDVADEIIAITAKGCENIT